MQDLVTPNDVIKIADKLDYELNDEFFPVHGENQPIKKLSKSKIEIFGRIILYLYELLVNENEEISDAEKLASQTKIVNAFKTGLSKYYDNYNDAVFNKIINIVSNETGKYSSEDYYEYLTNYVIDPSCLFIFLENKTLNSNPLEITDFGSIDYKKIDGLKLDFESDISTIINSKTFQNQTNISGKVWPGIFSAYSVYCIVKAKDYFPTTLVSMIQDISNDIWSIVERKLPEYRIFKEKYFDAINKSVFDLSEIRNSIEFVRFCDIKD